MFTNVLQSIEGVGIFPIISLIIFFTVFVAAFITIIRADKEEMERMANLPFESTTQNSSGEE